MQELPCGHFMHKICFMQYTRYNYTCPVCCKSLGDMSVYFRMIDSLLERDRTADLVTLSAMGKQVCPNLKKERGSRVRKREGNGTRNTFPCLPKKWIMMVVPTTTMMVMVTMMKEKGRREGGRCAFIFHIRNQACWLQWLPACKRYLMPGARVTLEFVKLL